MSHHEHLAVHRERERDLLRERRTRSVSYRRGLRTRLLHLATPVTRRLATKLETKLEQMPRGCLDEPLQCR